MALIIYSKATQLGSMMGSIVNGTIQMKSLAARLKGILDASITGNDYTLIESLFQLEAGQGVVFYTEFTSIADALASIPSLSKLDQG